MSPCLAITFVKSLSVAVVMLASTPPNQTIQHTSAHVTPHGFVVAQAPVTSNGAEQKVEVPPPPDAKTLTTRADTSRLSGDIDKAISDYDAALKVDPLFVDALYGRAVALRTKGDRRRALRDLDAVLKLKPDFEMARASRKELFQEIETQGARLPLKQDGAK